MLRVIGRVLLSVLAAVLLLRAVFLSALIARYRERGGVLVASLHAAMLAGAGLLAIAAAISATATLYLALACGLVLVVDLLVQRALAGKSRGDANAAG